MQKRLLSDRFCLSFGGMRTVCCLLVGAVLWVGWGAVRGVAGWSVSGGTYLLMVVWAGAVFGLVWPDGHLRTGVLLVVAGFTGLISPERGGDSDLPWWWLTLAFAACAAAGSHWLALEIRRRLPKPRH